MMVMSFEMFTVNREYVWQYTRANLWLNTSLTTRASMVSSLSPPPVV